MALPLFFNVAQNMTLYFQGWRWPEVFSSIFEKIFLPFNFDFFTIPEIPFYVTYIVQFGIAVLAMLFVAYLVRVRPYRTKIDGGFALALGIAQLVVCVAMVGAQRWPGLLPLAGWALVALSFGFFAQAIVAAVWAAVLHRRRAQRPKATMQAESAVAVPLLAVPVASGGAHAPAGVVSGAAEGGNGGPPAMTRSSGDSAGFRGSAGQPDLGDTPRCVSNPLVHRA